MFADNILDHVQKRVNDTLWSFEELDGLNIRQVNAIRELVSSALTDTRKKFENATIEANDE